MKKIKNHPFFIPGAVIFVFMICAGALWAINILAQTNGAPCIYTASNCSNWGDCQISGLQYCEDFNKYPPDCQEISDPPPITKTCTYNYPTCNYTCLEWGPCRSDGTRECVNTRVEPQDCSGGTPPSTKTCTFETPADPCVYTYSDWSDCSSTGYQTRNVKSALPTGCYGTPVVKRSCTYVPADDSSTTTNDNTSDNTTSTTTAGDSSTSTTASCIYQCSSWSVCKPEGYKIRTCYVPSGTTCTARQEKIACTFVPASDATSTTIATTTQCAMTCSDWGLCTTAGLQFQKCWPNHSTCPGDITQNQRTCTAISCNFNYSPWSACADGLQYRSILGAYPAGCVKGEPIIKQSCTAQTVTEASATENQVASTGPVDPNFSVNDDWKQEKFGTKNCTGAICDGGADPDGDGLSNNDELRYGTDPLNRDTDGDGKTDGQEIASGTNPLASSAQGEEDEINFENAKTSGEVNAQIYDVETVEMVDLDNGERGLLLTGKGPALSYVTVYIYSELPTVLTVKTDASGNWSYTLEEQVEDGDHEIYVAVTDSEGKVKTKSEPLPFVKTAQAVSVAEAGGETSAESSRPQISVKTVLMIMAGALFLAVAAFFLLGYIVKKAVSKIKMM